MKKNNRIDTATRAALCALCAALFPAGLYAQDAAAADAAAPAPAAQPAAPAAPAPKPAAPAEAAAPKTAAPAEAAAAETAPTGEAPQSGFKKALNATGKAVDGYLNNAAAPETHNNFKPWFDKAFSLSLATTGWSVFGATDFPVGITDIMGKGDGKWKKNGRLVINFDEIMKHGAMDDGADFGFGFAMRPFTRAEWGRRGKIADGSGWGLSFLGVDARFDLNLGHDIFAFLSEGLTEGTREFDVTLSGAVFVETLAVNWRRAGLVGRPLFLGVTAAHYVPALYMPRSTLGLKMENSDRLYLALDGAAEMYLPYNFTDSSKAGAVDWGGVDLSVQAEYALFRLLDVGLTMTHIPLVPAALHTKVNLVFDNEPMLDIDDFINQTIDIKSPSGDFKTGEGSIWAPRPMSFDFYALYRPLAPLMPKKPDFLVLRPNMGFTVLNPSGEAAFNRGLQADLNVSRLFTLSWFNGKTDGFWRNRLGFDFRLGPVVNIFLAAEMRSQSYAGAWTLKGAAAEFGLKWGGGARGLTIF